jgi:hypothetical protein
MTLATIAASCVALAAPASGASDVSASPGASVASASDQAAISHSPSVVNTLVEQGQYVSISEWGLACGHNERMTDSYIKGMVQKALMYRHCASSGSVRRKADAILDGDGPCYSIPANTARVLQAKFVFPRTVWRGAYAC